MMNKNNFVVKTIHYKGINLTELLVTLVITSLLLIGSIDMMSYMFRQNANFNNDISMKQSKMISIERIKTKIREAADVYSNGTSLKIPSQSGSLTVTTGSRALAAFVPVFDSSGNVVQPTGTTTSFLGIAFSIITESQWDGINSGKYVLIETNYSVNLAVSSTDALTITGTLPSDWSSGTSYLIAKNLSPANLTTMGTQAFNVQGNIVSFAFVPANNVIYFGSTSGVANIDDRANLNTVNFRNYRR